ncbi:MAG: hypothetical protein JWO86_7724 [Myxococcaceae bacterium]|nr:hypothetical protein [Myxococcaceae bacterium]
MALVSALYTQRSTLVHSGDSTELRDDDVSSLTEVVQRALTHVLTDQSFTSLPSAAAFEQLLDERVFG